MPLQGPRGVWKGPLMNGHPFLGLHGVLALKHRFQAYITLAGRDFGQKEWDLSSKMPRKFGRFHLMSNFDPYIYVKFSIPPPCPRTPRPHQTRGREQLHTSSVVSAAARGESEAVFSARGRGRGGGTLQKGALHLLMGGCTSGM